MTFRRINFGGKVRNFCHRKLLFHENFPKEPSLQELATFSNLICNNKKKVALDNVIKIEKFSCLQRLIRVTGCIYQLPYRGKKVGEE